MSKIALLFLVLALSVQTLSAQCLSGPYSIGTIGADYPDIQSALDDLAAKGWSDTVFFNLQPGVYEEQLTTSVGPWSSSCFVLAPAIFRKDPAQAGDVTVNWPAGSGSGGNFVLRLFSSGLLEFENIRFTRTGGDPQSGHRRLIESEGSNALFRHCVFEGQTLDESTAQAQEATASLVSFSGHCTFDSCRFEGGSWGLWSGTGCQQLTLRRCRFDAQGLGGVGLKNAYGTIDIRRNRFDIGAGIMATAIRLDSCYTDTRIAQNHIESTGDAIRAAFQQPYSTNFGNTFAIAHNFLIAPAGRALHLDGDVYATVAFNSVRAADGFSLGASYYFYAINGKTGTVAGNIFEVSPGPALELATQEDVDNIVFEDNCYVPSPIQSHLVQQVQSGQTWLFNEWRSADRERYSLHQAVAFVAPDDLHLAAPDDDLNGRAVHFALYVTELNDIDNEPMPASWPDIGADQFDAPVANADLKNAGGSQRRQPCGEVFPLRFALHNTGEKAIENARIAWSLNGQPSPDFEWQGSLDPGVTDTITVTELPFVADSQYLVEARIGLINGKPDIYDGYNSAAFTLYSDLSGNEVTVGLDGQFPSVKALDDRLKISQFCGPTRIMLLPGEHVGSLEITEKHAFNPSKTLEITTASGDPDDVSWTTAQDNWQSLRPTLRLYGVKHAWVHDLRLSGYHEHGLLRADHCSNLLLENCRIEDPLDDDAIPLVFETDTAVLLRNCLLTSHKFNVWFVRNCQDIRAEDCRFLRNSPGPLAVDFYLSPDCSIENSYILGGINLWSCMRFVFRQTESHCLNIPPATSAQFAFYALSCDSLQVTNSIFSNTNLPDYNTVNLAECRAAWFAHNTVRIREAPQAALSVQLTSAASPDDYMHIHNNILVSEHPAGPAMYVQSDPKHTVSDHNVFFSAGQNLIATIWGGSGMGLADWQNLSGQDLNSRVFQPPFFTENDLRIAGDPAEIAGKAAFLPGISDTDLDGDPRAPGGTDPGADQFAGLRTDLAIAACNLPVADCHALPEVKIKLKNDGPDTLRRARIHWSINGDSTLVPLVWRGHLAPGETSDWLPVGEFFAWKFDGNMFDIRAESNHDFDTLDNRLQNPGFAHRMGGDYTVGGARPDFHNIHRAAEMLAAAGVCADTRFLLRPGNHSGPKFYEAPGLVPGQTIRFEPDGPGMQRGEIYAMELRGLSQVEFRRMHFDHVSQHALTRHLTFEGCAFTGYWGDYSAGDGPMAFRNCRFQGNTVLLRGDEFTARDHDLLIENCQFGTDAEEPFSETGDLTILSTDNVTVRQCRFGRTARAGMSDVGGSVRVEQNRFASMPALTMYRAVADPLAPALVANNFFRYQGYAQPNPSFNQAYLVEMFDCRNLNVQHNSFFFEPTNPASDYPAAFSPYASAQLRFENNLVKTRGEAFVFNWVDFAGNYSNFNHFDAGPKGLYNGFSSLNEWKSLSQFDSMSTLGLVKFEAEGDATGRSGDLHLSSETPNIPLSSNMLAAIPTDFDGQLRQALATTIGADEPSALPLAGAVWPGDCDRDQRVTTLDWLHLGVAMGQNPSGQPRPDPSITWSPKYAADWPDSVLAANAKHADTNGDGLVSTADTLAIVQNFSQEHFLLPPLEHARAAAVLSLQMPAGPVAVGQELSVPVLLSGPVEDWYGLAFDLGFSAGAVQNGSFWVDFAGTWLAPAMGFYRPFGISGHYPVAIVRTDGANTTGAGQVAVLHFQVGAQSDSLKINLSGVRGILSDGGPKPLSVAASPAIGIVLGAGEAEAGLQIRAWPNPAKERLFVSLPVEMGAAETRLLDGLGRCVLSRFVEGPVAELVLGGIPAGAYRLLVLGEAGVVSTVVVVD
ncbi:MAG: right-handed parallel beta-helix repeat-containing protein [Saprospiraceae bacterium]